MQDTVERINQTTEPGPDWRELLGKLSLVMVGWAVVIHAFAQVFIAPVAIFGLLFGIGSILLRKTSGKTAPIFLIVASVALLAGSAPIIAEALPYPDSPFDFVLSGVVGGFVPIAILLAAVGALRGWSTGAHMRLWYGTIGLVAVLLGVSLIAAAGVESDVIADGDVALDIKGVEFLSDTVTVDNGRSAIFVDNQDALRHTFTIESLDLEVELPAGSSRRFVLPGLAPGSYEFICSITGHEDMTGSLVVSG